MATLLRVAIDEPWLLPATGALIVVLYHLIPYLADPHHLRSYPGPFLAKFSRFWLGFVARGGSRYKVIHELHQRYGGRWLHMSTETTLTLRLRRLQDRLSGSPRMKLASPTLMQSN